jgi:hypothetical protein
VREVPKSLLQRTAKDEKSARGDQGKTDGVIPGYRLAQAERRKSGKHHERNDLLHGLELGRCINGIAVTIGRNRQAIRDKGLVPS